jgi:hypothetical protein
MHQSMVVQLYRLRARAFQRSVSATDLVISQLDDKASAFGAFVMLAREFLGKLGIAKLQTELTSPGTKKTHLPAASLQC